MKAKAGFDAAMERARHLLTLYDLLCDTRTRNVRSDWSGKFKQFMGWPGKESITRVDGKGSLLVLRQRPGLTRQHFGHGYTSELLRFSVVAAISALDRYLHDLVTEHSWKLLSQKEEEIPNALRKLHLPMLDVRKAIIRARQNGSRPGNLVKKSIQTQLHKEMTFQGPTQVLQAAGLLGIKDLWKKLGEEMPGSPAPREVQKRLHEISRRRNQIVHEADLVVKSKGSQFSLRDISGRSARKSVEWIDAFGAAFQRVVDREVRCAGSRSG